MSELARKECVPCKGGVPPLGGDEIARLLGQIEGWEAVGEHHITRTYTFKDFMGALGFVNRIGNIAEAQGHHPDIHLAWGKAQVEIWTHKINGLTESDFILAAKCDEAYAQA